MISFSELKYRQCHALALQRKAHFLCTRGTARQPLRQGGYNTLQSADVVVLGNTYICLGTCIYKHMPMCILFLQELTACPACATVSLLLSLKMLLVASTIACVSVHSY